MVFCAYSGPSWTTVPDTSGFLGPEELLSKIKTQHGKVILIPRANKKDINAESRFSEDSQDLNRSFGKITQQIGLKTWQEILSASLRISNWI